MDRGSGVCGCGHRGSDTQSKVGGAPEQNKNPAATHLAEAEGNSMIEAGIRPGDFEVVDRSVEP